MTRLEVLNAFREVASEEFSHIPNEEDIEYEFSERFNNKMVKLLKKAERKGNYSSANLPKRILAVAAAIVIILAGLMSVSAVRETVIGFIYEKINGNYEIMFDGEALDKLGYRYSFSVIPEGFVETERLTQEAYNYVRYDNDQNNYCVALSQSAIGSRMSISMDDEHGHIENYNVNGTEINIYIDNYGDLYIAYWIWGSDYMQLVYSGQTTIDEILELIKTIS